MDAATKKGKKRLWLGLLLFVLGITLLLVMRLRDSKPKLEEYQPIEEFEEAFEAIQPEEENHAQTYDLEKTIRVINSLEVAQT